MRIYFDTSVFNGIVDSPEASLLVEKLRSKYSVLLSSLNLGEMLQTTNPTRRLKLFIVASRVADGALTASNSLLLTPMQIIRNCLIEYTSNHKENDLFFVHDEIEKHPARRLLMNPSEVLDEVFVNETRNELSKVEPVHHRRLVEGREDFQIRMQDFQTGDKQVISRGRVSVLRHFLNDTSLLSSLINSLMDRFEEIEKKINGHELLILKRYDFIRYFAAVHLIEIYDRQIKQDKFGKRHNPGWADNNQIPYLAATDIFVTRDKNQLDRVRLVSRFGQRRVCVWSYDRMIKEVLLS